jgi:hypothetical protein
MTIISLTEARIRDHRRNAELHQEFASAAEEDGKLCMALLYRNICEGHLKASERLEATLKTLQSGDNLLDRGRDSITGV